VLGLILWALQAAEKRLNAVILSAAKDLALFIFKAMRDSSSPLLLRMTALSSFSAACLAREAARLQGLKAPHSLPWGGGAEAPPFPEA
jgi:hypothetical protein